MAQRYEVKARGQSGTKYRVELHDSTYTGSTVTTLDADGQFIEFVGGSDEFVGKEPIWGKEARLNVITSEDLSPLFGLRDRDVEVRVYDASDGNLVYKGYLLTDFFSDNPFSGKPGIELRAADGLTTLEKDSLSDLGYSNPVAITTFLAGALGELFSSPLDVEVGTKWYPGSGGLLGSSDCPIQNVKIDPQNYREDRPNGSWFNVLDVVKDVLKGQGLTVKQARVGGELVWTVYQRTSKTGGSIKTWRFDPTGTLRSGQPVTRDISKTLGVDIEHEPKREFERRVQSVSITHDHTELDQLVLEGGFEDGGVDWNITSVGNYTSEVKLHSNMSATPPPTENNKKAHKVNQTGNPSSSSVVDTAIQGGLTGFNKLPDGSFASISYKHTWINEPAGRILFNIGSYYLKEFSIEIKDDTLKGDVTIPVADSNGNGLKRPIPEGARLPIGDIDSNAYPAKASIELTQRAERGAGEVVGKLNGEVKSGDYLYYAGLTTNNTEIFTPVWEEKKQWKDREIFFSLEDGNGNLVTGQAELHLQFAYGIRNTSNQPQLFWDDIGLSIFGPDGSTLNSTTRTASVPEFGESRSQTIRSGTGPTESNIARLIGETTGGTSFKANNWGLGSGGGSLSLAGLGARERLRHARNHLERLKLTVFSRDDKTLSIEGHEVITLDGTDYTVSSVTSRPDDGRIDLTLLELVDHGTTDLSIETTRQLSEGGSSTSAGTASGGGGDIQDWDGIDGKPTDLFASGGGSDGFSETIPASWANLSGKPFSGLGDGITTDGSANLIPDSTVARTDIDEVFDQKLTVQGDLVVNGDEVIQNTETVTVQDNLLFLNEGETGTGVTKGEVGFEADRGSSPPVKLIFDEATDWQRIGVSYKRIDYSSLSSGPFSFNEKVVGGTSGAEGIIWEDDGSSYMKIKGRTGSFTSGETITGQSSGASASVDSITVVDDTQAVATREDSPNDTSLTYWNATENRLDTDSSLQWDGTNLLVGTGHATVTDRNETITATWTFDATIDVTDPANSPSGSKWSVSSPGGNLGTIYYVGNGSGSVAKRWDFRASADAFWLRNNTDGNTPIYADDTGKVGVQTTSPLYALDVNGPGQIGGVYLDGNEVYVKNGTAYFKSDGVLYFQADGGSPTDLEIQGEQLQNPSYTSGILGSGWTIDNAANGGAFAEFDNVRVRNELRAHIFKKDIVKAANGYLLVTNSAEVAESKTVSGSADDTLKIKDGEGNATFADGDLLWVKSISDDGNSIYGVKMTVLSVNTTGSNNGTSWTEYNVSADGTNESGGNVIEGDTVVKVGNNAGGPNGYLLADASSQYSPFLDVYDGVDSWNAFQSEGKLKARLGDLSGVSGTDVSPSGYGLYSENVYLSGEIVAQSGKVANYFQVGSDVYMWDASSSISGHDEIRISSNGTGDGTTNFVRLYMDPNNDTWGIEGYDGGNEVFHLGEIGGSDANRIAGWNFDNQTIYNDDVNGNGGRVWLGSRRDSSNGYGFFADDSSGNQIFQLVDPNTGDVDAGMYANGGSDEVRYGHGQGANGGIGLLVEANDNKILQTDQDGTAYVDNLVVRNGADIKGEVNIGDSKNHSYTYSGISSGGWYRIASNEGNRAKARFNLWDREGGRHNSVEFTLGCSYNKPYNATFSLHSASNYSSRVIQKVRLLTHDTFDTMYVEVYLSNTGSDYDLEARISDNYNSSGWEPAAQGGNIPSGYSSREWRISTDNVPDQALDTITNTQDYTKIDGGTIDTGTVLADAIKTGTITANEMDVDNLFTDTFTMKSGGVIKNGGNDWRLDYEGLEIDIGTNGENKVQWANGLGGTVEGQVWSDTNALHMQKRGDCSNEGEGVRLLASSNSIRIAEVGGGVILIFENPTNGVPTDSELEGVMGDADGALYAVRQGDNNMDLGWAETDIYGNLEYKSTTF